MSYVIQGTRKKAGKKRSAIVLHTSSSEDVSAIALVRMSIVITCV